MVPSGADRVEKIGDPPWSRGEMLDSLAEFAELYESRPIRDNVGGMRSPHLFLSWFVLRKLCPSVIVESGVWYGQGTWFFEKACPRAELYCIDPNLAIVRYRSPTARYFDRDFSTIDWSALPQEEVVLFFDDHQNALERVKVAKRMGFKHLIFEDNYPPFQGDCYSLKKVFANAGLQPPRQPSIGQFFSHPISASRAAIRSILHSRSTHFEEIPANEEDAAYLRGVLAVYAELPPVFKMEYTRWGDRWDQQNYPTPDALLDVVSEPFHEVFFQEAVNYTWMCYARLR